MVSSSDSERARAVISYEVVEKGHPMQRFMAGICKSFFILEGLALPHFNSGTCY